MEEQPYSGNIYKKEKRRRHLCSTCGSSFTKKSDLTRHERIHTGERPFSCHFCGANFSQASSLKTHIRKHTGERPYKCQFCDQAFAHSHRLKSHILKRHARIHEVNVCQKCCSTPECLCDLQRHADTHTSTDKLKCNDSDDRDPDRIRCISYTEPLTCKSNDICISEFEPDKNSTSVSLSELSSVSSTNMCKSSLEGRPPQKEFMCDVCGSFYPDGASLRCHLKSHDNHRSFQCNSCHQCFTHKSGLNKHQVIHSHKRPYICQVCSSSFSLFGNLKIHMRIHSGEKPYTCEVCGTKFTHSQALKTHRKTHSQGKDKHICKICNSSFSSMKFLNQHLQTHWASGSFEKSKMSSHPVFVIQEASINEGLRLATQTDFRPEPKSRSRQLPSEIESRNHCQCKCISDGKSGKRERPSSPTRDDQKGRSRSPSTTPLNGIDSFPTFQDHFLSETESITPMMSQDTDETQTVSKESSLLASSDTLKIHEAVKGQNCEGSSLTSLNDQADYIEEPVNLINNLDMNGKTIDLCSSPATDRIHGYMDGQENNFATHHIPMLIETNAFCDQSMPSPNVSFKHNVPFLVHEDAIETRQLTITDLDLSPKHVHESISDDVLTSEILYVDKCKRLVGCNSELRNEDRHAEGFSSNSHPPQKMSKCTNIPSGSSMWESSDLLPLVKQGPPLAENHPLEDSRNIVENAWRSIELNVPDSSEIVQQHSTHQPILSIGQVNEHLNTFSNGCYEEQHPPNEKELCPQPVALSWESFTSSKIQESAKAIHISTPVYHDFGPADEIVQKGKLTNFSMTNEDFLSLSHSSGSSQPDATTDGGDTEEGSWIASGTMEIETRPIIFSSNTEGRDSRRNGADALTLTSCIEEKDAKKLSFEALWFRQGNKDPQSQPTPEIREESSTRVTGQSKISQEGKSTLATKDFENEPKPTNAQNDSQVEQETSQSVQSDLKCANCPLGLFDASVISVLCQDECFGVMVERNSCLDENDLERSSIAYQEGRKGDTLHGESEKQSLLQKDPFKDGDNFNLSYSKGPSFHELIQNKVENVQISNDNVVAASCNETQQSGFVLSETAGSGSLSSNTASSPSLIGREQMIPSNAVGTTFQETSMTDSPSSENLPYLTSIKGKEENVQHSFNLESEKEKDRQFLRSKTDSRGCNQFQHSIENQENPQSFNLQTEKERNVKCLNFESEMQENLQYSPGGTEKQPAERLTSSLEKYNVRGTLTSSKIQTNTKAYVKDQKNSSQRLSSKKCRKRKATLMGPALTNNSDNGCSRNGSRSDIKRRFVPRQDGCHSCKTRLNQATCPQCHQQKSVRKPSRACQICHLSFLFRTFLKSNFKTSLGKSNISIKELQIPSKSVDKPQDCLLLGTHASCVFNNTKFPEANEIQPETLKRKEKLAFLCQICGKALSSLLLLNRHINGHKVKTHTCNSCSAVFNKSSNLVKHMRIHNGDRPYKCQTCSRSFTQKTNLQVHMRIHTGEMPFRCQQCGSSFAHSQALKLHMRFHAKDKRFVCQTCGKGFVVKAALDKHLLSHTQEKPFACNTCDTRLSSKSSLSRHVKKHKHRQGLLPFFCSACPARFAQPGHRKLHLKSHPICRVADRNSQA